MKKYALTGLAAAVAVIGFASAAQAGDGEPDGRWLVRGRIINVNPSNDGGDVVTAGGKPKVGSDTVPEVDLTYFFTQNIGVELIAATTEHKVQTARGTNLDLGKVKLLPPTLTAQYHYTCNEWKPYVGAGITYAHFYDAEHPAAGINSVKYDDAFGVALQAGVDYKLTDKVYLNADVKKIFLKTDVTVNDTTTAKANLNPVVAGVGIGYRF